MRKIVQCPNGHYYDMNKSIYCPFCNPSAAAVQQPQQKAQYQYNNYQYNYRPQYQPAVPPVPPVPPMPQQQAAAAYPVQQENDDRNRQPTVGWLVCVKGPSEGKTYPIRENRNFIGRSRAMDIVIENDDAISREKHAVITYVPKQSIFIAQPGESRELFYVNDKVVLENVQLKAKDKLEIGRSEFIFVPLCGENFSWKDFSRD